MMYKDEDLDNLGGLGDLLPAEVLKEYKGSIVFNIYGKGSNHVDHVENQNFYGEKWAERPKAEKQNFPVLPEVLATEEAMALWEKAQAAGYVDDHFQPLISRTQSALLADAMAERLGIREKWKVFETLWNRKYMRSDYNLALAQQQSLDFQDELKSMFQ